MAKKKDVLRRMMAGGTTAPFGTHSTGYLTEANFSADPETLKMIKSNEESIKSLKAMKAKWDTHFKSQQKLHNSKYAAPKSVAPKAAAAGAGAKSVSGLAGFAAPVVAGLAGAFAISRAKNQFDKEIDTMTNEDMRNQENFVNIIRSRRGLPPIPMTPKYVYKPRLTDKIESGVKHPIKTIKRGASVIGSATRNFLRGRK